MARPRAIYAMAAVERITGESAETIRSWEDRYGLPAPERSPGGQLLYTRDDVERLRWLAWELAAGRTPSSPILPTGPMDAHPPDVERPQVLVLLAERDPFASELAEYFLRTEGYQVEIARSAQDALAGAIALGPDVAVVELTLSGHAGLQLCRQLHDACGVAVVAVSTLDKNDEALAAGAEAFLVKPLDPVALISAVKDLLGTTAFLRVPLKPSQRGG